MLVLASVTAAMQVQLACLPHLLKGRDAVARAQTGSGAVTPHALDSFELRCPQAKPVPS